MQGGIVQDGVVQTTGPGANPVMGQARDFPEVEASRPRAWQSPDWDEAIRGPRVSRARARARMHAQRSARISALLAALLALVGIAIGAYPFAL